MNKRKYIFFTGGVVSSLGKGIACASVGKILESAGYKLAMMKIDPYINVDPGTMNPYQHGEVYVTEDGAETDLDLGHYERFTKANITKESNITTGKIYLTVIENERKGLYLGNTVQVVPHIINEIKRRIVELGNREKADIVLVEIGGTVGDIESLPFLEAIRQMKFDVGRENVLYIHLTLVPYIKAAGELKTKPTQHSVKTMLEIGIQPDILLCRTEKHFEEEHRKKIALFCNVEPECVIEAIDVKHIYEVPLNFQHQNLGKIIAKKLKLKRFVPHLQKWEKLVKDFFSLEESVDIALVGKYIKVPDAYKSINEALVHGGMANNLKVNIIPVDSENLEEGKDWDILKKVDGILVPGGFGNRGIEGKIKAAIYAMENGVPYFGICLGMQMAVVAFARKELNWQEAHSTEINSDTPYPVISLLSEQKSVTQMGGTMRLGAYPCKVKSGTILYKAYKKNLIYERHRHRWEVNNDLLPELKKAGLIVSGKSPDGILIEAIEIENHPWFVGVQYHPEFKSKPDAPHPLFISFITAAKKHKIKA